VVKISKRFLTTIFIAPTIISRDCFAAFWTGIGFELIKQVSTTAPRLFDLNPNLEPTARTP